MTQIEDVYEYLAATPNQLRTIAEIVAATGVERHSLSSVLRRLMDAGRISRREPAMYFVNETTNGLTFLRSPETPREPRVLGQKKLSGHSVRVIATIAAHKGVASVKFLHERLPDIPDGSLAAVLHRLVRRGVIEPVAWGEYELTDKTLIS